MGLVIRQSILTTIISYAGVVIGFINLIYLYPRFLESEQVGLLRSVQDAAILFAPFAQFGLAHSIFRFYPQMVKDKATQSSFISLILLLAIGGFGVFLVVFKIFESKLLSYFEENAQEIIQYSSLILWLTLITLINSLLEAYCRSLLKTVFPNLLKEVVVRIFLSILVLAYFSEWLSFNDFIISTVLAYLICLLILVFYLAVEKNFKLSFSFAVLDKDKLKALIYYSLFSFAGSAGMVILGKIDSLMVLGLLGATSVAIYTTAYYMSTIIEIPKRAMTQVALPLIARAFEKKDLKDISVIYQKISINQFIVGALLLIGVYINIDNIFHLMPKQDIYEAGKWVVIIVGTGKLIDMLFGPSSEIIVLSKYYWFNIVLIILLAGLIIFSNSILIPIYGINGAALGTAITIILFNAVKYIFIWLKLKIQPFNTATLKVMAITTFTIGLNLLIPKFENAFIDIFIRSSAVTIFYSSMILVSKSSPDGNAFLNKMLKLIGMNHKF